MNISILASYVAQSILGAIRQTPTNVEQKEAVKLRLVVSNNDYVKTEPRGKLKIVSSNGLLTGEKEKNSAA